MPIRTIRPSRAERVQNARDERESAIRCEMMATIVDLRQRVDLLRRLLTESSMLAGELCGRLEIRNVDVTAERELVRWHDDQRKQTERPGE